MLYPSPASASTCALHADREQIVNVKVEPLHIYLCDHEVYGEDFEVRMNTLKPHYGEAHADVMKDPSKGKEDMGKWMAGNKVRFEAA